MRSIGWKLVLGLNFGCFKPEVFAEEAEFAFSHGKDVLAALEIGNEPDLYFKNGLRGPQYGYPEFLQAYRTYASAIRRKKSEVPLSGPGTCRGQSEPWFGGFLKEAPPGVVLFTHHFYPLWNSQIKGLATCFDGE